MKNVLFLLFTITMLSSCSFPEHYFSSAPECTNEESHDKQELTTENQTKLANKIKQKEPKEYRYFFKTFLEERDDTYMVVNFRNDEACFNVKMLVDKWDKLAGMRKTNGQSYPKELYDLQWEINGNNQIAYLDMQKIID